MKYLKGTAYVIIIFFALVVFMVGLDNREELAYFFLKGYLEQHAYLVSFQEKEGDVFATVTYKLDIYENNALDISNLYIYTDQIGRLKYYIDQDNVYNPDKLREVLLANGLADIIDEDLATKTEIECQNSAREGQRGHWNTDKSATGIQGTVNNEITILDIINWLISFFNSILFVIINCILAILGFGTVAGIFIKIARRNNVDVILGGDISSGKTTIIKRLENPGISESELLSITSTKGTEKKKGNRIAVGKRDIYPYMLDNPGQQIGNVFDAINKKFFRNPRRILIYTIALFPKDYKGNKVEKFHAYEQYRVEQVSAAVTLLSILLESKTIKSLDKIIVFVNKMDLLYSQESDYQYKDERDKILNSVDKFGLLLEKVRSSQKACIIYGSALKDWGIYKLRDIIKDIV